MPKINAVYECQHVVLAPILLSWAAMHGEAKLGPGIKEMLSLHKQCWETCLLGLLRLRASAPAIGLRSEIKTR